MSNNSSPEWGSTDEMLVCLPDLAFAEWCQEVFGLNRGVYNTIDRWLFERGITNVILRRQTLVAFLRFAAARGVQRADKKFLHFGQGGLVPLLNEFVNTRLSDRCVS